MHGAGAVRFDTKVEGGPLGEGGERYYNYVRLVRDLYQDSPTRTTTDPSTSTTTASDQTCPAENLYGEYSEETELLRYLRDAILSKTPEGQEITEQYYAWSPVIVEMMEKDESFKQEVKQMIDEVLLLIIEQVE